MPKFFFNISDGSNTLDDSKGLDLASPAHARAFALAEGHHILRKIKPCIVVTDTADEVISAVDLTLGSDLEGTEALEKLHSDLSKEKWKYEHCDHLTAVFNRATFFSKCATRLVLAESTKSKLMIALIHMGRLKEVNSAHGNSAGDRLIKEVASRIKSLIEPRGIVARVGSSDFGIIISDPVVIAEGIDILRKMQNSLRRLIVEIGTAPATDITVGVSVYPDTQLDPTILVESADRALEVARHAMRGGMVVFSPEISQTVLRTSTARERTEAPYGSLTSRELTILALVIAGKSSRQIAQQLDVSIRTVDFHRANILQKFNAKNTADLTRLALANPIDLGS